MREKPIIDKKDDSMTYIFAVESDECAKLAAEEKDRVNQVDEYWNAECVIRNIKRKAAVIDASTAQ